LQEYQAGTLPFNGDSDNDLLSDGQEYLTFGTDPLAADSDGGGRWDIDELFSDGTDPLFEADHAMVYLDYGLNDENSRYWEVDAYGYLEQGSNNAFFSTPRLYINGAEYTNQARYDGSYRAATSQDGREFHMTAQAVNELIISRRVFIPSSNGAYARYIETISNPTDQSQAIELKLSGDYGGNTATTEVTTSSGGSSLTPDDSYIVVRDSSNNSYSTVAHVFSDHTRPLAISDRSNAQSTNDAWQVIYELDIPAGETRYVVHYLLQESSVLSAQAAIQQLLPKSRAELSGMSEDMLANVVNILAQPDSDLDTLSDAEEVLLGTLANNPDTDGDGLNDNIDPNPLVQATAPVVTIASLTEGGVVVRGDVQAVTIELQQPSALQSLILDVNGIQYNVNTTLESYTYHLAIPLAEISSEYLITVIATDVLGQVGSSVVTVNVIDDPGFDLTGRVVDVLGNPVAGATVQMGDLTQFTDGEGRYAFAGISSLGGSLSLNVQALFGAELVEGSADGIERSVSGVLDIGDIVIEAELGLNAIDPIPESQLTYEQEINLSYVLYDSANYKWDIYHGGYVNDGSSDAFDGGNRMDVNGVYYDQGNPTKLRLNSREMTLPIQSIGLLNVSRKLYVPADDKYVRYLDIIENTSGTEQVATVRIYGNLGSDSSTAVIATSDGDTSVEASDYYVLSDDSCSGCGDPAVGRLYGTLSGGEGEGRSASLSGDNYSTTHTLTIPAGGRRILMHYVVQDYNRQVAETKLQQLADANFGVPGLTNEEVQDIVNFKRLIDSDHDGMSDADEVPLGLDPLNPDSDGDGVIDGIDGDPTVMDIDGPVINLISPTTDYLYIPGEPLSLVFELFDSNEIVRQEITLDGITYNLADNFDFTPAVGSASFSITVDAEDIVGNSSQTVFTFNALSDAATTVVGQVMYDDTYPVPGLRIDLNNLPGYSAVTDADGRFQFDGVSSNIGPLSVYVTGVLGGQVIEQYSTAITAVRGSTTDVGSISLSTERISGWWVPRAAPLDFIDVESLALTLPFDMSYYDGNSYNTIHVYQNGRVTLGNAAQSGIDPDYSVPTIAVLKGDYSSASVVVDHFDGAVLITWQALEQAGVGVSEAQLLLDSSSASLGYKSVNATSFSTGIWPSFPVSTYTTTDEYPLSWIEQSTAQVADFTLAEFFPFEGSVLRYQVDGNYYSPWSGTYGSSFWSDWLDSDGDGLYDVMEVLTGTLWNNADTDADGLNDGFENQYGFNPNSTAGTGEAALDGDFDGLSNLQEQEAGTNPELIDSDTDGVSDFDELQVHSTNPLVIDSDDDGLSDGQEITLGTNPLSSDSDTDGLSDDFEVNNTQTNPLLLDSDGDGMDDLYEFNHNLLEEPVDGDADSDGLSNLLEHDLATDPQLLDSDSDGLSDYVEFTVLLTNPLSSDSDSDGMNDRLEVVAYDTDPHDASSYSSTSYMDSRYYAIDGRSWRLRYYGDFDSLSNGLRNNSFRLNVNGSYYYFNDNYSVIEDQGNQIRFGTQTMGQFLVSRIATMQDGEPGYIRYVEKLFNNSHQTQTAKVHIDAYVYRSFERDIRVMTSSGDSALDSVDGYLTIGDAYASNALSLLHVFGNQGAEIALGNESIGYNGVDDWRLHYEVTVPPGEARYIVHYANAGATQDEAQVLAGQLQALPDTVYRGLTPEIAQHTVNWAFDYTPQVRFEGLDLSTSLLAGSTLQVNVSADLAESVTLYVNGQPAQILNRGPYNFSIVVPTVTEGGNLLTLEAVASGIGGRAASTDTVSIPVGDTATTVTGRVVYQDDTGIYPISDVMVVVQPGDRTAYTNSQGVFNIADVILTAETLSLSLSDNVGGQAIAAELIGIVPVASGITDVGDIADIIEPATKEMVFNTPTAMSFNNGPSTVTPDQPMSLGDMSFTAVDVYSNGKAVLTGLDGEMSLSVLESSWEGLNADAYYEITPAGIYITWKYSLPFNWWEGEGPSSAGVVFQLQIHAGGSIDMLYESTPTSSVTQAVPIIDITVGTPSLSNSVDFSTYTLNAPYLMAASEVSISEVFALDFDLSRKAINVSGSGGQIAVFSVEMGGAVDANSDGIPDIREWLSSPQWEF